MTNIGLKTLEMWRDGFAGENSDAIAEIMTDGFIFVGSNGATRSREETLNWISTTPDLVMSDLEVLYENDEVLVGLHSVVRAGVPGKIMFFARIEDGKFSFWRVNRADTTA
jgi:hypothetical protein